MRIEEFLNVVAKSKGLVGFLITPRHFPNLTFHGQESVEAGTEPARFLGVANDDTKNMTEIRKYWAV